MATKKTNKNSSRSTALETMKTPKSAAACVVMMDDSMAPKFFAGDVLIIDYDVKMQPGYYTLHVVDEMLLVRRLMERDGEWVLLPENPAYPVVSLSNPPADMKNEDPQGVVTEVRHVDGTTERLDLKKLITWDEIIDNMVKAGNLTRSGSGDGAMIGLPEWGPTPAA
jgi:hypothetical protein